MDLALCLRSVNVVYFYERDDLYESFIRYTCTDSIYYSDRIVFRLLVHRKHITWNLICI